MKKGLILFVLCLSFLLPDNTSSELVLKAGIGSGEFGIAFLGIAAALLMRDNNKK